MQIENRSYNPGQVFRPRPFVLDRPEAGALIVTTSWTAQSEAERISQMILEQTEQTMQDDLTTLHEKGSSHSEEAANRLRQALQSVGQTVYKTENLKQARLLIETLVIRKIGSAIIWAQVGQPNLYLLRKGRVAPLSVQPDCSVLNPGLPPLPRHGLGLEVTTRVSVGSIQISEQDQLLLLAQSWGASWPSWGSNPSFQKISADLIESQPDLAFWAGLVAF